MNSAGMAAVAELKIAFLAPSVSRAGGGIFEIERSLARALAALPDVHVNVFGTQDEFTEQDRASWQPVGVRAFARYGPRSFGWSPGLVRAFSATAADVGHLHALWAHTSLVMRRWSRRQCKPFVTTLHGMLDAWALGNSRRRKQLAALAYERDCLARAACVQVNSEAELNSARAFGLKMPICVVANGVELPRECSARPPWAGAAPSGLKILLYLGRLHPKKGLVNLLNAWQQLRAASHHPLGAWRLAIAGWSQAGHEDELKALAAANGIEREVLFLGPLYGDAKTAAYQHADAVILPSFSEGLPMAVLEAWSFRKPVVMTPQCNVPEGFTTGAAIEAEPEAGSLKAALAALTDATDAERSAMGARGRELVERKFSWPRVAADMCSVYRWLVGGGTPPACVVSR